MKHATFVERVWFEEAFTGRTRAELGIVGSPENSFVLDDDDDITSIRAGYRAACQHSRDVIEHRSLDDVVSGNRRGDLPIRWVMLHMLREVAQHCGHAEFLREQLLATGTPAS